MKARNKYSKVISIVAIISLVFLVLVSFIFINHVRDENKKLEYRAVIDKQNTDGLVNLDDGRISVILPCEPREPYVIKGSEIIITTTGCSEVIGYDYAQQRIYGAKSSRYVSGAIDQKEYLSCDTTNDSSNNEELSKIYDANETINGNVFKLCGYSGDKGSNLLTATIVRDNVAYIFTVTTEDKTSQNPWPEFRRMLETFRTA